MTDYWTSFTATDEPSSPLAATPWPPFRQSGARQVLNLTISRYRDGVSNCDFWDEIGYDRGAALFQFAGPTP